MKLLSETSADISSIYTDWRYELLTMSCYFFSSPASVFQVISYITSIKAIFMTAQLTERSILVKQANKCGLQNENYSGKQITKDQRQRNKKAFSFSSCCCTFCDISLSGNFSPKMSIQHMLKIQWARMLTPLFSFLFPAAC